MKDSDQQQKPKLPANSLPPAGSHYILLNEAIKQTTDFRKLTKGKPLLPHGTYQLANVFNRDIFDQVLKTPGCEGLRFYFGVKEPPAGAHTVALPNVLTLVFCAIDCEANDIINVYEDVEKDGPHVRALTAAGGAGVKPGTLTSGRENSMPCKPCCGSASVLNGE